MVDRLHRLAGVESVDDAAVGGLQAQGVVGGQVSIADSEYFYKISNLTENISILFLQGWKLQFFLVVASTLHHI